MTRHPTVTLSIAAHFAPSRVAFLAEVLSAVAEWQLPEVDVEVDTNDLAISEEASIRKVAKDLELRNHRIRFTKAEGLEDPFHLTWVHKLRLREWFESKGSPEDLFIYVEDDIVIRNENLTYFRERLPALKSKGLIPGFLLYETRGAHRMAISFQGYQTIDDSSVLTIEGQQYVNPAFPYWAGFIVDRDLCAEYLRTDSADRERAETVLPNHSCRVHSAMGLCYENVQSPFTSRFVVPVADFKPIEECQVWHCAQNYSKTRKHNFGTIKVDDIFVRPGMSTKIKMAIWQSLSYGRMLKHKVLRECAKLGLIRNRDYLERFTQYE